ncbi:TetR family transcriptional regulator [Acrocarpospora phusangensis]|uniref:TetR family transcriptional regulator n=1 Tax=Acrocarpospora phusangensis TaxID=1070424 RepID=A0A919UTD6_9ACTN|nr:TetR/AcrR family transcriptional regulator C-terminal domain-containing protein [Acrocarpospora phusangensis]GIH29643.1 TetR family transcriptional regulator [Acrocarpospora phusangensis]
MSPKEFTSVWARPPRAQREPGLSRDQIVRAAVELLDTDGLDALSMRKLGAKLGAGATSVYWHVANKDELLELAMDEAYAEMVLPPGQTWRETAGTYAYGLRSTILRHSWLASLIGTLPSLGPQALRCAATMLDAFSRGGFRGLDIDYAVSAVVSYTLGATLPEASWRNSAEKANHTEQEQVAALSPVIERVSADYPALRERYLSYGSADFDPLLARKIGFDYGLVAMMDGLEARLRQAHDQHTLGQTQQSVRD